MKRLILVVLAILLSCLGFSQKAPAPRSVDTATLEHGVGRAEQALKAYQRTLGKYADLPTVAATTENDAEPILAGGKGAILIRNRLSKHSPSVDPSEITALFANIDAAAINAARTADSLARDAHSGKNRLRKVQAANALMENVRQLRQSSDELRRVLEAYLQGREPLPVITRQGKSVGPSTMPQPGSATICPVWGCSMPNFPVYTLPTSPSGTALLGNPNVESQVGSIPAGQAEAFQATAHAGGNVQSLVVYLDSASTVSRLVAGLYADASGHPGTLLSQGSSTQPVPGAWNPILVPAANLAAGMPYWIAILGTTSGTLAFRDATAGTCASEVNALSSLTSLPAAWTTGTISFSCPASVFGDSTKVVFYDTFAGTTISPNWTVISRHGEYSQSETECNIPQQVVVNNGLTITTAAQSWVCGDFHPDGTVWHTPQSWPYVTGDIQWANLNFTYGTVEIQGQFPNQNTSLWPAFWLLGSNCQTTNPFTGETGVGPCPNIGTSGYTEIDTTECYNSGGWCQFHVANPSFGIGGGCDAEYTVDTNWHIFKTVWTSSSITQYMDGKAVSTCKQELGNPMFLLIQTQTGGAGGDPNNSLLPAALVVNYVKVTQS